MWYEAGGTLCPSISTISLTHFPLTVLGSLTRVALPVRTKKPVDISNGRALPE